MSKILITGASGFVGSNLTNVIKSTRCVVRKDCKHSFLDSFEIDDLNGSTNWDGAFDGIETVVHLAGLAHGTYKFTAHDYERVNVLGTIALAKASARAGVKRFVFVSTIGVNGIKTRSIPFSSNMSPDPRNTYAASKLKAEQVLIQIQKETQLEVVIVRPPLIYGPGAPGNFNLLVKLINYCPFLPFGLTRNKRDFISIQNLVDFLVVCISHENAPGNIFLVSDNQTVCTKEFTNAIAKGLGKKVYQLPIPIDLIKLLGNLCGKSATIEQLFGNLHVDSSDVKRVLDWTPPYTMEESMLFLK
jgi:nucleoside-diphosphate-sugar epimerase